MSNIYANTISPRSGDTINFTSKVSIAGTLAYEDVTNIDSVGLITARQGVVIGTGASIGNPSNNELGLYTDSSERLRIDSSGKVGIGITSPDTSLHVVNTVSGDQIRLGNDSTIHYRLGRDSTDGLMYFYGSQSTFTGYVFDGVDGERMRIDSSGRLLVGTYSALVGAATPSAKLQIIGNTSAATDRGAQICLGHSAGAASIDQFDLLGAIHFTDNSAGEFARIEGYGDGAAGTDDYPGRLVFSTTADGDPLPTERMRIDSSGKVGVGTASPGSILDVRQQSTGSSAEIRLFNTDQTNATTQEAAVAISPDSRASGARIVAIKENADFSTNPGRDVALAFESVLNGTQTERMRIDSSGNLLIGGTLPASPNAEITSDGLIKSGGYPITRSFSYVKYVAYGYDGQTLNISTEIANNDITGATDWRQATVTLMGFDGASIGHFHGIWSRDGGRVRATEISNSGGVTLNTSTGELTWPAGTGTGEWYQTVLTISYTAV